MYTATEATKEFTILHIIYYIIYYIIYVHTPHYMYFLKTETAGDPSKIELYIIYTTTQKRIYRLSSTVEYRLLSRPRISYSTNNGSNLLLKQFFKTQK